MTYDLKAYLKGYTWCNRREKAQLRQACLGALRWAKAVDRQKRLTRKFKKL